MTEMVYGKVIGSRSSSKEIVRLTMNPDGDWHGAAWEFNHFRNVFRVIVIDDKGSFLERIIPGGSGDLIDYIQEYIAKGDWSNAVLWAYRASESELDIINLMLKLGE